MISLDMLYAWPSLVIWRTASAWASVVSCLALVTASGLGQYPSLAMLSSSDMPGAYASAMRLDSVGTSGMALFTSARVAPASFMKRPAVSL
ncbi:hypothetical protein AQ490_02220 [Wenjunlia vitaminophila]|uniref:Uncharacterized protein n=1 Tax=Wenjunlia vitaminophila TaxID=76728 RepID=A0A0T6LY02_WENVI|nr:hypothetical protein AQ490_02220 [Wenjunlia vitaminophila]